MSRSREYKPITRRKSDDAHSSVSGYMLYGGKNIKIKVFRYFLQDFDVKMLCKIFFVCGVAEKVFDEFFIKFFVRSKSGREYFSSQFAIMSCAIFGFWTFDSENVKNATFEALLSE